MTFGNTATQHSRKVTGASRYARQRSLPACPEQQRTIYPHPPKVRQPIIKQNRRGNLPPACNRSLDQPEATTPHLFLKLKQAGIKSSKVSPSFIYSFRESSSLLLP